MENSFHRKLKIRVRVRNVRLRMKKNALRLRFLGCFTMDTGAMICAQINHKQNIIEIKNIIERTADV